MKALYKCMLFALAGVALTACEDDPDGPGGGGKEGNSVLKITHNRTYFDGIFLDGSATGTIDWGDGSEKDNYSIAARHAYQEEGEYTITIQVQKATKVSNLPIEGVSQIDLSGF